MCLLLGQEVGYAHVPTGWASLAGWVQPLGCFLHTGMATAPGAPGAVPAVPRIQGVPGVSTVPGVPVVSAASVPTYHLAGSSDASYDLLQPEDDDISVYSDAAALAAAAEARAAHAAAAAAAWAASAHAPAPSEPWAMYACAASAAPAQAQARSEPWAPRTLPSAPLAEARLPAVAAPVVPVAASPPLQPPLAASALAAGAVPAAGPAATAVPASSWGPWGPPEDEITAPSFQSYVVPVVSVIPPPPPPVVPANTPPLMVPAVSAVPAVSTARRASEVRFAEDLVRFGHPDLMFRSVDRACTLIAEGKQPFPEPFSRGCRRQGTEPGWLFLGWDTRASGFIDGTFAYGSSASQKRKALLLLDVFRQLDAGRVQVPSRYALQAPSCAERASAKSS